MGETGAPRRSRPCPHRQCAAVGRRARWVPIVPISCSLGPDEFDEGHLGTVAATGPEAHDAGITAGAFLVPRSDLIEEPGDDLGVLGVLGGARWGGAHPRGPLPLLGRGIRQ